MTGELCWESDEYVELVEYDEWVYALQENDRDGEPPV
jgi:hypothetical protein